MTLDFCGIGNACIDIVAKVDDQFLVQWKFPKGICTYLTLEQADRLEQSLPNPCYIPGGCAANTAAIVTALGGNSGFIGRVADDRIGQMFMKDITARGIRYQGMPDTRPGAGSTRIFAMTTPDAERTFAAFYGVQRDLCPVDLDREAVAQAAYMYLDGYALNAHRGEEAFLEAASVSRTAGKKVVFNPNDLSVMTLHPAVVQSLIKVSHGLICNFSEALFLTKEYTLETAMAKLIALFEFGAVTHGEAGVYVFDHGGFRLIPAAIPPAPVVDTNGAGDAFAGGFMFGLARGFSPDKAAALGNLCAAVIITHYGARPLSDFQPLVSQVS